MRDTCNRLCSGCVVAIICVFGIDGDAKRPTVSADEANIVQVAVEQAVLMVDRHTAPCASGDHGFFVGVLHVRKQLGGVGGIDELALV